jgi:hypothetical protein
MRCPVPISEICKYVINCPGCQHGPAWQLCPGFRMKVHGMPGYAVVIIFNDEGNILAEDSSERRTRVLTVPGQPPGARQFVLVMHKRAADWRKSLSLKFEFQPMDTPSSSGRENPGNP